MYHISLLDSTQPIFSSTHLGSELFTGMSYSKVGALCVGLSEACALCFQLEEFASFFGERSSQDFRPGAAIAHAPALCFVVAKHVCIYVLCC